MTLHEKAQRFLRVNGVWDMTYADGRHLSDRLAEFLREESIEQTRQFQQTLSRHWPGAVAYNVDGEGDDG